MAHLTQIQFYRGAVAGLPTLASGEPAWTTDTHTLYVGDGVTNHAINGGGGSSPLTTKGDVWGYSTVDARIPVGSDGDVLTADSGQALGVKWAPGAAMAIGSPVASGTANCVLFVDGSGNLGQDAAGLVYDAATNQLAVTNVFSGYGISATDGTFFGALAVAGSSGGAFSGGATAVSLGSAAYAIDVALGTIRTPGSSGNTYRWEAGTSAPATNAGTPTSRYGGDTNYCGDPDAWVLVNIGGTNYKLPAFLA